MGEDSDKHPQEKAHSADEQNAVDALKDMAKTEALEQSTKVRKTREPPKIPVNPAYIEKLKAEGLTERGLKRMVSADGAYNSVEKRCRVGNAYVKYFKQVEPELHQKSLDFRLANPEQGAKAEDIVMFWAHLHGKESLNEQEFRFQPKNYTENENLKQSVIACKTFTQLKSFIHQQLQGPPLAALETPKIVRKMPTPMATKGTKYGLRENRKRKKPAEDNGDELSSSSSDSSSSSSSGDEAVADQQADKLPSTPAPMECYPLTPDMKSNLGQDVQKALDAAKRGIALSSEDVLVLIAAANKGILPVSTIPPSKPPANSVYIYNRVNTRGYKQDGYSYRKETHSTLIIRSIEKVKAYSGVTVDGTLRRRCCWELNKRRLEPDIVLIQYMVSDIKSKASNITAKDDLKTEDLTRPQKRDSRTEELYAQLKVIQDEMDVSAETEIEKRQDLGRRRQMISDEIRRLREDKEKEKDSIHLIDEPLLLPSYHPLPIQVQEDTRRIPDAVIQKLESADQESLLSMADALMDLYDCGVLGSSTDLMTLAVGFPKRKSNQEDAVFTFKRIQKYALEANLEKMFVFIKATLAAWSNNN